MTSYLISYDIGDDRLREKLAALLQREGCTRIQKSVFFAPKFAIKELRALQAALHALVNGKLEEGDSVLCVPVARKHLSGLLWEGGSPGLESSLKDRFHILI
ncbi:MAG: CRISPR-associated endonuclease Cas2 [Phaeodactylibacter sp.]|nr:CRISPR-associated endonuclease Cas2 [Phaeodactylibacter sp.]MCB9052489.1 CRISPR-associated endonuclease Cas2 [Lewinellaceae bacterium]